MVDIKDVTGSGFIYRRYLGILLGLLTALAALLTSISFSAPQVISGWKDVKWYQIRADDAKATIAEIHNSENKIAALKEEITENQKSIEALENQLAEKTTLQNQIYVDNAINIPYEELLYDTEINIAYEEYLRKLDDIFCNSELYRLLCSLYEKLPSQSGLRYYDVSITDLYNALDLVYHHNYDDYLNGNNMVMYYYEDFLYIPNTILSYGPVPNITIVELAYLSADSYDVNEISDLYEDINSSYVDSFQELWENLEPRLIPETEAVQAAYEEFLEKVAPSYIGRDTSLRLSEIVVNYVRNHPDASFSDRIEILPTQYDSEIEALRTQIQEIKDLNETAESEITKLQEIQQKQSQYEERYKEAQKDASNAFTFTTLVAAAAGVLVTFLISCFLVFFDYLKKRKTMFQIQYAGGCIAFDVSYYAKAEIDDFQKQLRRAKDFAEESASKVVVTESLMQSPAQNNVPDELRKYSELLKEGLISQEEYDAIKKKILNL